MARTRAQRRRHSLFLTLALVVTLVVLVFARDVTRSAHGAIGPRRSENRSFGGLTNALIKEENGFDQRLSDLLRGGDTLSRPVLDARLGQLQQQLNLWDTLAEQLRRPKLAHDVNDEMADLTEQRIAAYETIFAAITNGLTLPSLTPAESMTPVVDPAQTLLTTSAQWAFDRWALIKEPGRVKLHEVTTKAATLYQVIGVQRLVASSTLLVTRGVGIAAVSVSPAPLPAHRGVILLPPVPFVHLGISVENAAFVEQTLTLQVTLTPTNGPLASVTQTFKLTLAPLQSYAVVPKLFATVPSERATLRIALSGAPPAPGMSRSRTYEVVLSPSGNA